MHHGRFLSGWDFSANQASMASPGSAVERFSAARNLTAPTASTATLEQWD